MMAHLAKEGIETRYIHKTKICSSGTALIIVDAEGQNEIIVIRGANEQLLPEDIERAQQTIASAKLVAIQLEIPLETVQYSIETAHRRGVPVILNPAPAPPQPLGPDLLKKVFILVPNEVEAEALTGLDSAAPDFVEESIRALQKQGPQKVIITLGDKGCAFGDEGKIAHVPAYRVRAEDTTGAGDAFVGALAAGLGHFSEFSDTIKFASAAAALSVTKLGAQSSLPMRPEIHKFLQEREQPLLKGFLSIEQKNKKEKVTE
jgi:ribokinase